MGGGEHGHHGHDRPHEMPDWRKYRVEDVPELLQVQKLLAQKGLKDPWLRNEVWRYDPGWGGTAGQKAMGLMFRGFKWGVLLTVATIGLTKAYEVYGPQNEHGHGHGGHH